MAASPKASRHDAPGGDADQDADADHRSEMIEADYRQPHALYETFGEGLWWLLVDQPLGMGRDSPRQDE